MGFALGFFANISISCIRHEDWFYTIMLSIFSPFLIIPTAYLIFYISGYYVILFPLIMIFLFTFGTATGGGHGTWIVSVLLWVVYYFIIAAILAGLHFFIEGGSIRQAATVFFMGLTISSVFLCAINWLKLKYK